MKAILWLGWLDSHCLFLRYIIMAGFSLYSRIDLNFVKSYLTVLLLVGLIPAYAQGPIKSTYHNVNARYNAYFYAKQRILEVEAALAENYPWN